MKNLKFPAILILLFIFMSCEKTTIHDPIGANIHPVSQLHANYNKNDQKIKISWVNPDDTSLFKVEISYKPIDTSSAATNNPILVDATPNDTSSIEIKVSGLHNYMISAVAINKAGMRSKPDTVKVIISQKNDIPLFLKRADTLMESLVTHFLDGMPRGIWTNTFPKEDGYWDGAATVWGQGAAFSAYAALKKVAQNHPVYKAKYQDLYDDRLFTSINKFITTQGQKEENDVPAYAVYPANGNERFYDDNVWIGIAMANLYKTTEETKYLEKSKLVWDFLMSGMDSVLGGGIYWKENQKGKNTCSNMPAVVLASKLYRATQKQQYLDSAKSIYNWCKSKLQDPADYLYWDNIQYNDEGKISIDKAKYTYNSGQAIEAGALLYDITGNQQYLTDAENTAGSIFKKWGTPFHSYTLNKTFVAIDPAGDVWFRAVMLRGLIALYKIDGDRKYIDAYEDLLEQAWQSDCRNEYTNFFNDDFRGGTTQSGWSLLAEAASVEMLARMAEVE